VNRSVKWIILVVWILALLLLLASGFRSNRFGWGYHSDSGWSDGIYTELEYIVDQPFESIYLDDDLICNTQIEQNGEKPSAIKVSGDNSWVRSVRHEVTGNRLRIYVPDRKKFHIGKKFSNNSDKMNLYIHTPGVKSIKSKAIGNLTIPHAFEIDDLNLEIEGVGKFQADSLCVRSLKVNTEGVGSVVLGGQVQKARLDMEGAGSIDALALIADSVFAEVDGVGSIKCYPIAYLKGEVNGIGSLTYKEEPKQKHVSMIGIGHIGKN
jgi:hypothetical protein